MINVILPKVSEYLNAYDRERYLFEVTGPQARKRGYLTFKEFYKIAMWKSTRQKQRYLKNRASVERVSQQALSQTDETKRIAILCELKGVGIPTASAILAILYPDKYPLIDIRCLKMLEELVNFHFKSMNIKLWIRYLTLMRKLAKDNNLTPRELDKALFAMHVEKLEKEEFKNLYD